MTITLLYPVYRQAPVTQKYGENPGSYTVGCTPDGSHNGLDFGIPEGTPVYATADGLVTRAGMDSTGYGIHVRIEHAGFTSIYGHLRSLAVKTNQRVTAGQPIGESGNTGNSTGPHLHFEIRKVADNCKSTVDPLYYLQQSQADLIHGVVTLAGNGLRIRTAPVSGEVKGYLAAGTEVDLTVVQGDWGRLFEAGERWVCLRMNGQVYVQLEEVPTPDVGEVGDQVKLERLWAAHPELH